MFASPNALRPLIVSPIRYQVNWVDEDNPNTVYKEVYGPIQNNPITDAARRRVYVHFDTPVLLTGYADDYGSISTPFGFVYVTRDQLIVIVSVTGASITPASVNSFTGRLLVQLVLTNWDPETLTYNNKPSTSSVPPLEYGNPTWINSQTNVLTERVIPDTLSMHRVTLGTSPPPTNPTPVYGLCIRTDTNFNLSADFGSINFLYISQRLSV